MTGAVCAEQCTSHNAKVVYRIEREKPRKRGQCRELCQISGHVMLAVTTGL